MKNDVRDVRHKDVRNKIVRHKGRGQLQDEDLPSWPFAPFDVHKTFNILSTLGGMKRRIRNNTFDGFSWEH